MGDRREQPGREAEEGISNGGTRVREMGRGRQKK